MLGVCGIAQTGTKTLAQECHAIQWADRVDRGVDGTVLAPVTFTIIDLVGFVCDPRPAGIRRTTLIFGRGDRI